MKIGNRENIYVCLVALALLAVSCVSKKPANPYNIPLSVGNNKIFVDIADTNAKRSQGLSGQEKLQDDQGMLFIFDSASNYGFWMKEMKFDLDLIWIRDKKIVGITKNVPHPNSPGSILPLYYPPSNIDTVLEVNAGWSEEHKLKVGDEIKLVN